jgi:ribosome-associated protein
MRQPTRSDASEDPAVSDPAERPSKTQLKRQMHELQRLGQRLVELPPAQLQKIELPEQLRYQIELARRINGREALRRQLQYVGRLMRDTDGEAIRARLAVVTGEAEAVVGLMHRCERLREQLLDDDEALTRFLSDHHDVDAQWLHAKIRAARRERLDGTPPRHLRELYRWLHEQLLAEVAP